MQEIILGSNQKGNFIHEIINNMALEYQDYIAIKSDKCEITYKELNEHSNKIARFIISKNLEVETPVAICMDRSPLAVITLIGILKAGCSILPLGPLDPIERNMFKLRDSKAALVLTEEKYTKNFNEYKDKVISLSFENLIVSQWDSTNLSGDEVRLKPENLSYIIYTSGSTGEPKGVLNEHKNISQHILSFIDMCKLTNEDNFLGFAPITFDASIEEIFAILCCGGTLILLDEAVQTDISIIKECLYHNKVSVLSAPPPILNLLNNDKSFDAENTSLRLIVTGGDTLNNKDVDRLINHITVMNGYGLTEATISSLWHVVNEIVDDSIPIGKPMKGKKVYILDDNLKPVSPGEIGEIYLGGEGIARGYLNDAKMTAEKFIADPFSEAPGARMVKTGDLGSYLQDGSIKFHGRVDRQVSIRGFRVELEEVESVLRRNSDIKEAAVVCVYRNGEKFLRAYIVINDFNNENINLKKLRSYIKEYLPDYMIPSEFLKVEFIPRNQAGKVDYDKLKLLECERIPFLVEEVKDLSSEELAIRTIWSDLLGIEQTQIPVTLNFFEAGGNSILFTMLVSRIKELFGINVLLKDLIERITIEEQANYVREVINNKRALEIPKIEAIMEKEKYTLSSSQQRIWFLTQLESNKSLFNTVSADIIRGDLDVPAFCKAFQSVIKNHPIFSVCFDIEEGIPYQKIRKDMDISLEVISLENLSEDEQNKRLDELINRELDYKFDVSNDVLIRAFLVRNNKYNHIFVVNIHHIITDNWSWKILASELEDLYKQFTSGVNNQTKEKDLNYFDYIEWEKKYLHTSIMEEQKNYWLNKLSGKLPVLDLPTFKPRPSILNNCGSSIKILIPKNATDDLEKFSMKQGVSLYATLLAAFKVLLYKYTDQTDIIVGTPVANRNISGTEKILGLLLNVVAIRDMINPELSFVEFVKQVHKTTQEAFVNQDYPFEKIVEHLDCNRSLSHSPVFQIMFDYHGDDTNIFTLDGLEVTPLPIYAKYAKNDLTVTVIKNNGELILDFEYNKDLYNKGIIERLTNHYKVLLDSVIENPIQEICKCNILSEDEKNYLLHEYNSTEVKYPLDKCLHEVFENQVKKTPNNIAYKFLDEEITYKELNIKANKIANYLRELGVKPEFIVAVCINKSLDMPAVLLGIIKAGGAYLPLDPNFPAERINKMLGSSEATLLITEKPYDSYFSSYKGKIILLEELFRDAEGKSGKNLVNLSTPKNLFNIVFTSASTGEPKGVMLTIESVMNRIYWSWDKYPFNDNDVIANQKSYTLVGSFWEIFGGLLCGIPTVIIPRERVMDPALLWDDLIKNKITFFFASPPILSGLISEAERNNSAQCCLRIAATSAEPITPKMIERWKKVLPNAKLLNLYGSTEDCSDVSVYDTDLMEEFTGPVPVGKPLSNTKIYILDKYKNLVPIGVVGEIHVAGTPVARGYLNSKEQTDSKFISNPFSKDKNERMYATGDLGAILPDGNLQLVGRSDHQVKIHGYKIELGEIELALKQHPSVINAAVKTYITDENKKIVAYVVLKKDIQVSSRELGSFLKGKFPSYMIPNIFIIMDTLPVTPNGKIDRLALPEPTFIRPISDIDYVEPRTPTERAIAEIWQDILKIDKIGVHDNFFNLGGDSLTAIQMIGHLRHLFLINIPLMNFFENPTISDISSYISNAKGIKEKEFYNIKPAPEKDTYPLASIQEGFWFYHQLEPKNIFYNIAANRIKGKFHIPLFKKALEEVIKNQNALRMLFKYKDGRPYIVLKDSCEVDLPIIDLSSISEENKDKEMMRIAREEISSPFDLENGPLLRAKIFKYGEDDHVVLINMHHIVSDGWSINILLAQISELYSNYFKNPLYKLARPEIQYTDYILWQKEKLNQDVLAKQLSYWKEKLSGNLPVLNLKEDKKRPELVTYKGGIIQFTLDATTTERLRQLGKKYRSTLYMVLLAIYKTVLYRYTGQEDIIIGSPIVGRGYPQIENVIGCFVNTLVMRTKFKGNMKFSEFLQEVRTTCLEAFENSNVPFDRLVSELNPKRDISRSPVFQAMMTMQDKPLNLMDLPGLEVSDAGVINDLAPYDLSVIIWVENNKTTFYVEYYKDAFDEETISRLMRHYRNILYSVLENPSQTLDEIPILSKEEEDAIIEGWNSGENALVLDQTVKDAVRDQVEKWGIDIKCAKVFILDNNHKPVPAGSVGKLYLAGKGNRTEDCIHNPYDEKDNILLYFTNKNVYYSKDRIVYLDNYLEEDSVVKEEVAIKPYSEIEKTLIKIWSEVLKVEDISKTKSFFDMGGNSIMLVEVVNKINQYLSKQLQVMDLFKYPTISSLAGFLLESKDDNPKPENNERVKKQLESMNRIRRIREARNNGGVE